jgi:hypothetical protein
LTRRLLLTFGIAGLCAGCATVGPRTGATAPGSACLDADYRGSFTAPGKGAETFRVAARLCPGGRALLEFRGVIGGAGLVAGVRQGDAVRLLFPGRRTVVDGPDSAAFWERWLGVAIDGTLLARLAGQGGASSAAGWSTTVTPPEAGAALPAAVDAVDARGARLALRKTREDAARSDVTWPEVPPGFTVAPADAVPAAETAP